MLELLKYHYNSLLDKRLLFMGSLSGLLVFFGFFTKQYDMDSSEGKEK
jgi:hypothetical protein